MKRLLPIMVFLTFTGEIFIGPDKVSSDPDFSLMIFSPDIKNPQYEKQLLLLAKDPLGIDKRNILILEVFPEGGMEADGSSMEDMKVEKLRSDYQVEENEFRVILINRRGEVKLNQNKIIDSVELFTIIDNSPL